MTYLPIFGHPRTGHLGELILKIGGSRRSFSFRFSDCSYSHGPRRLGAQICSKNKYKLACPKLGFEGRFLQKRCVYENSVFFAQICDFPKCEKVIISLLSVEFHLKVTGSDEASKIPDSLFIREDINEVASCEECTKSSKNLKIVLFH